jgi:hypothetical protein
MLRLPHIFLFALLSLGLLLAVCNKDPIEEPEPEPEPELEFSTSAYCDNSCYFSRDGEYDDGGYNSKSSLCKFGTDCTDCGRRVVKKIKR